MWCKKQCDEPSAVREMEQPNRLTTRSSPIYPSPQFMLVLLEPCPRSVPSIHHPSLCKHVPSDGGGRGEEEGLGHHGLGKVAGCFLWNVGECTRRSVRCDDFDVLCVSGPVWPVERQLHVFVWASARRGLQSRPTRRRPPPPQMLPWPPTLDRAKAQICSARPPPRVRRLLLCVVLPSPIHRRRRRRRHNARVHCVLRRGIMMWRPLPAAAPVQPSIGPPLRRSRLAASAPPCTGWGDGEKRKRATGVGARFNPSKSGWLWRRAIDRRGEA